MPSIVKVSSISKEGNTTSMGTLTFAGLDSFVVSTIEHNEICIVSSHTLTSEQLINILQEYINNNSK